MDALRRSLQHTWQWSKLTIDSVHQAFSRHLERHKSYKLRVYFLPPNPPESLRRFKSAKCGVCRYACSLKVPEKACRRERKGKIERARVGGGLMPGKRLGTIRKSVCAYIPFFHFNTPFFLFALNVRDIAAGLHMLFRDIFFFSNSEILTTSLETICQSTPSFESRSF